MKHEIVRRQLQHGLHLITLTREEAALLIAHLAAALGDATLPGSSTGAVFSTHDHSRPIREWTFALDREPPEGIRKTKG